MCDLHKGTKAIHDCAKVTEKLQMLILLCFHTEISWCKHSAIFSSVTIHISYVIVGVMSILKELREREGVF